MIRWIESKQIEFNNFLKVFWLIEALLILALYIWLFGWYSVNRFSHSFLGNLIITVTLWLGLGIGVGVLFGSLVLLYPYLRKEWDLHVVFPYFFKILVVFTILVSFITLFYQNLETQVFGLGFMFGSLFPMLAYSAEVEKEHK